MSLTPIFLSCWLFVKSGVCNPLNEVPDTYCSSERIPVLVLKTWYLYLNLVLDGVPDTDWSSVCVQYRYPNTVPDMPPDLNRYRILYRAQTSIRFGLGYQYWLGYRCAPHPITGPVVVCGPEVVDPWFYGNSQHVTKWLVGDTQNVNFLRWGVLDQTTCTHILNCYRMLHQTRTGP